MKKQLKIWGSIFALAALIVFGIIKYNSSVESRYKKFAQTFLDKHYQQGEQIFCYYLGKKIEFPYKDYGYTEEFYRLYKMSAFDDPDYPYNYIEMVRQYETHRLLPIYYESGLLTRKQFNDDPELYEYDLSEEGRKYIFKDKMSGTGKSYFCYGQPNLLNFVKITESDDFFDKGNKDVYITFTYRDQNHPDWADSKRLANAFSSIYKKEDKITIRFYERNGRLFTSKDAHIF